MTRSGTPVLVRRAGADDLAGLVAGSAGLSAEDGAARDPHRNPVWAEQHAERSFGEIMADPDMIVLVADHDGEVVGHLWGGCYRPTDMWLTSRASLTSMYVFPAWRGQGVGARLVAEFANWAREQGAAQVRVTAHAANEGAIRFYRRHGFQLLEQTFAADANAVG